jgi:hypothetical protein
VTSLADAVAKLESNNSPVNGPANGYANYRYQQFNGFVKQYGFGETGINNYASQVLKANPNATFGDFYGGYVTGTGNPATANVNSLLTTTQPGAQGAFANMTRNSPISPNTPLSQLVGDGASGFGDGGEGGMSDTAGLDDQMAAFTAQNGTGPGTANPNDPPLDSNLVFSGGSNSIFGSSAATAGQQATQAGTQGAGTKIQTSLQPSFSKAIGGWVSSVEGAFGSVVQGATSSVVGSLENWIGRGFLILIAMVIIFVALWMLLQKQGLAPSPKQVAMMAA